MTFSDSFIIIIFFIVIVIITIIITNRYYKSYKYMYIGQLINAFARCQRVHLYAHTLVPITYHTHTHAPDIAACSHTVGRPCFRFDAIFHCMFSSHTDHHATQFQRIKPKMVSPGRCHGYNSSSRCYSNGRNAVVIRQKALQCYAASISIPFISDTGRQRDRETDRQTAGE